MKPEIKLGLVCLTAFGILGAGAWATGTGKHCTVHHNRLWRGRVKVIWGRINPPFQPQYQFPNAYSRVFDGCLVDGSTYRVVEYCSSCRRAEQIWQAKHPWGVPYAQFVVLAEKNKVWRRTHKPTY